MDEILKLIFNAEKGINNKRTKKMTAPDSLNLPIKYAKKALKTVKT
jgi:hypothetical protein